MDFSNFSYQIQAAYQQGSVSYNGFNGFLDGVSKVITVIFSILSGVIEAFNNLVDGLFEINGILSDMITGITNNSTDGFPILQGIGTYRYLVGDFIFYLTYLVLAFSLALTIVHLVYVIYSFFKKMYNNKSLGGSILRSSGL